MHSFFKRKEDTFDYEASRICKCCNTMFKGRYCNVCGEKVVEPYERSFLGFLDNVLNAFTFLDGKFLRSLRYLILKPGLLSRNIADGKRVPYMKMVSLFFLANFFYFLFPFADSFNSSLNTQMNLMGNHSIHAKERVTRELEKRHISLDEFREKYEAQSTNLSKLLLVVLVLVLTLILMVINYSRNNYFFDHLLVSLEFYSFHLLVNMLLLPMMVYVIVYLALRAGWDWKILFADQYFSIPVYGLVIYFLARSQRIFYNQKWYWAIPKTLLIFYLFMKTVDLYREFLFYATVWTI